MPFGSFVDDFHHSGGHWVSCDVAMPGDDSTTLDVIEDVASMDMVGWTDVETVQCSCCNCVVGVGLMRAHAVGSKTVETVLGVVQSLLSQHVSRAVA